MNHQPDILRDEKVSQASVKQATTTQNHIRLAATESLKDELLMETTSSATLVVPQTDKEEEEGDDPIE